MIFDKILYILLFISFSLFSKTLFRVKTITPDNAATRFPRGRVYDFAEQSPPNSIHPVFYFLGVLGALLSVCSPEVSPSGFASLSESLTILSG